MARGFFIVFEGIDGSGTTTHARRLVEYLNQRHIRAHLTSEPSQGSVGQFLRKTLQDGTLDPHTDALLFAADRTEHTLKEVLPKMSEGFVVVSHRYLLSTVCYQSAKSNVDPEWIFAINQQAITPDLTIVLDIDPQVSMERISDRPFKEKFETVAFLQVVRVNYKKYVHPPKIVEVDSSQSIEDTFSRVLALVEKTLRHPLKGE